NTHSDARAPGHERDGLDGFAQERLNPEINLIVPLWARVALAFRFTPEPPQDERLMAVQPNQGSVAKASFQPGHLMRKAAFLPRLQHAGMDIARPADGAGIV